MLDFEETIMDCQALTDEELLEEFKRYQHICIEDYEDEEAYDDAHTKQSAIIDVLRNRGLEY